MPTPVKFWNKAAKRYAASPIKDMAAYEYTLERTRSYLTKDNRVLEIGCGTGSTALLLAPDASEVTGTDISPEMLQFGKQKAASQNVQNVTFKVASAADAAQDAAGFDVVLGLNIFHLVKDAEGVFASLHGQLAPDALFISKTPCLAEPSIGLKRFAFAALVPVMRLLRLAPYVRSFRFAELERAVENAGFEIIETSTGPAMSRFIVAQRKA